MDNTTYTVDGREFELKHHGVKGMKWGVRRYQNKDGTLTNTGKKRKLKYEEDLDRLNSDIIKKRVTARRAYQTNDPAAQMVVPIFIKDIEKASESGRRIVDRMKKKGLLSAHTTFDDYAAKYERKVLDNCKKYISEEYGIENPTDDVASYFFPTYVLTGRR